MLRVEIEESANCLILKLQGRFTGDEADNTRTLMTSYRAGMRLVIDATEITFIDSTGEETLSFFGRFGAEFVAGTSYSLDVCERLHLRLAQSGPPNANTPGTSGTNTNLDRRTHRVRRPLVSN